MLYNSSWSRRKRIMILAFAGVFVCIFFFSHSIAFASELSDTMEDAAKSLGAKELLDIVDNVFGSGYTHIVTLLKNSLISTVYNVVVVFAVFYYLFLMIFKIIQYAARGEFKLEEQLKLLLFFVLGLLAIIYADEIFDRIYDLAFETLIYIRAIGLDSSLDFTVSSFETSQWFIKILVRLMLWGARFMVVIPCWGIVFEIAIRKMFVPLAITDLLGEGFNSPGCKYIKAYFAIFIRIGVIYVIVGLMCILLSEGVSEMTGFVKILSTLGVIMGGVKFMTKSKEFINEAFNI